MKKLSLLYSITSLCIGLCTETVCAQALVTPGTNWRYLDNGTNQGTAWRSTSFSDATWKSGNAQLGYGDGDEATIVSYGPSSNSKYITTYFRKAITVANASAYSSLALKVKRDDGIVVYINGTERYRNNLPTGTISFTTAASGNASDDGNTWLSATIPASALVTGTNVIAVEIHQRNGSSSDISFDLELTGTSTTDTQAPVVSSLSPADNAASVSATTNPTIVFTENIVKGTGNIYVKEAGTVTQTIAVTSASVSVTGNTVTIDAANFTSGASVNIETDANVFRDAAGNNFAGISGLATWNFSIATATTSCTTIGCFVSVQPTAQTTRLVLPSTHTFQLLFKQGQAYTTGGGTAPAGHDFTGYVPINGSSTNGYVSVNHENSPGGVSILSTSLNTTTKLWALTASQAVSFPSSTVVKTERNCSGTVTPWGTIITAEETRSTGDANGDGYTDTGWLVEIDPVTKQVKQYGNGREEKLWAAGRGAHENCVVSSDQRTMYWGEDSNPGNLYKFVANTAANLSAGTLYVMKLNSALSNNEPTSAIGTWVVVPNSTQSDRNNTYSLAASLGGTAFNGIEDVEISPNGKIYFTAKGNGRVYRFNDNGTSISNFETFVGGQNYSITYNGGTVSEAWGTGNDNLAFDGEGNLWVCQDGGRNHLWVVKPTHTQASPKVELFATTPSGSEPTGLTFSPDFKYMFISFQHPGGTNSSQTDASGANVAINVASTVVIARKENLGNGSLRMGDGSYIEGPSETDASGQVTVYPNPAQDVFQVEYTALGEEKICLKAYELDGTFIAQLFEGNTVAGKNNYAFNKEKIGYERSAILLKIEKDNKVLKYHTVLFK